MRIVFDATTIAQGTSISRSITGVVYFDFGGNYFPAEGWNDFAVVIASWWVEAVTKLERGIDREVLMNFMDGPYYLAATRVNAHDVRMRCIERRVRSEHVAHEQTVTLRELRDSVLHLGMAVASACSTAGTRSTDLDKLKSLLSS